MWTIIDAAKAFEQIIKSNDSLMACERLDKAMPSQQQEILHTID